MRWNKGSVAMALVASAMVAAAAVPIAIGQGASSAAPARGVAHVKLSNTQQARRRAMRGPRGFRGPRGPRGPAGPQGPTGPSGNGAKVQNVTVNWQNGQWQNNSSAGFVIPGVGLGQIVCTPPQDGVAGTTWLRVYPGNPNHYITMWVLRQQDGLPPAVREAKYYPGAGIQDFNEGFNTVNTGPNPYGQQTSTGAFQGIISDRGAYGSTGASIPPTSFHLSFTWDFTDPSSARCYVAAKFVTGD